ncbi:TPR/glycosyl transferase domain protein [alpha proteobacterium U9-1i]|nr:TPR/glycosyl transferase domain protein [alpha proteobacterium U9-1i]
MRLLLITRHYPPAVSGGAKRPFLLAQALRKLGAEVFVIAPSLPEGEPGLAVPHPNRDPSGAPAAAPTLRDVARDWLLWPDPDIRWCLRAADAAEGAPWKPDWVWTTSPPESIHAAGWRVKQRTGARWLLDFRDHWLTRPHRLQRAAWHRRFGESAIARRWLRQADLVTCVDSSIQAELKALGAGDPRIAPHFAPVGDVAPVTLSADDINVVHTGSIALSDPEARIEDLLSPFEGALARNPALRLHLVGRLSAAERAAIEASPARARIDDHGVQPLETALGFQRAADALTLVGSRKTHVPPSKITEYLAADAPIIACGEGDWRKDPRVNEQSPRAAFAALTKGAKRGPGPRAPRVDEVAAQLYDWMRP